MSDRNRRVFEMMVRDNEASLMAYLRCLVRDAALADDLFQETLLTAWRKFDDCDPTRPLAPWLRTIALNLVRNARRKRSASFWDLSPAAIADVDDRLRRIESSSGDDWSERLDLLRACLAKLTDARRTLVLQRYQEGKTSQEIARQSGESPAAVRKQLQRVRSELSACIQRRLAGNL